MTQFQAKSLEEAYENATKSLNCSITDLEIQIVQSQSKGFFGLFAKDAIILVKNKQKKYKKEKIKQVQRPTVQQSKKEKIVKKEKIFDGFYGKKNKSHENISVKKDKTLIIKDVKTQLDKLFAHTCYKLDKIIVDIYDENTLYIEFSGEDAALLIGKEGYRYKALSYILFNWIHEKYNLMVRLEVAKFLISQEESVQNYLKPVIETIKINGSFKTKPLDGVLIHIGLKILRDEFPEKYVAVKTNIKGDKYILVNEYKK